MKELKEIRDDQIRIIRMKGTILLTDVSVLNGTFLRKSVDAYEEN